MDVVATGGLNITVVGVGTVFIALSMLVAVLTVMARLFSVADGGQNSDRHDTDLLARVALAAYGLHAASRTAVRGPAPASAWLRAARSRQVMRFERSQLRR